MLTNEMSAARRNFTPAHPSQKREYRNALGRFATGVSVVTTQHEGHVHGMTANAFVSVSLDPPLILLSVDNRSHMNQLLPETRRFGVNVLADDQEILSDHFAGRPVQGPNIHFFTHMDTPLLEGALAYFVTRVVDTRLAGDHTLYIAEVEHFECREGKPLIFFGGRYQRVGA